MAGNDCEPWQAMTVVEVGRRNETSSLAAAPQGAAEARLFLYPSARDEVGSSVTVGWTGAQDATAGRRIAVASDFPA